MAKSDLRAATPARLGGNIYSVRAVNTCIAHMHIVVRARFLFCRRAGYTLSGTLIHRASGQNVSRSGENAPDTPLSVNAARAAPNGIAAPFPISVKNIA